MNRLELRNITKIYGKNNENYALNDVSLSIEKGDFIAIMGPSGSGKSTLLNIIGCLDIPTSGEYIIDNFNVKELNNRKLANLRNSTFGFVVQYFALIDNKSVYDNVKLPLEYAKVKRKDKKEKVLSVLKSLNIDMKLNNIPKELSGGQCQRVAIARALVNEPNIILADEPTGALDSVTGQEVINILKELNKSGKTIIIVTHDEKIAAQADRIIKIIDGKIS